MRTPPSRRSLVELPERTLLVVLVRPSVLTTRVAELSGGLKSARLSGWGRERSLEEVEEGDYGQGVERWSRGGVERAASRYVSTFLKLQGKGHSQPMMNDVLRREC